MGFTNLTTDSGNTSRNVSLTVNPTVSFELSVTVNNPAWGSVSPTNGTYAAGSSVELQATPATYYRFNQWNGDATGTNNPLTIVLNTNTSVLAVFGEVFTTNHPTPHWWLADYGYTNDFETAVTAIGANGIPLWQSYIAGLDPNDPESQFRLTWQPTPDGASYVLHWNTVADRVYSIWSSTNLSAGFTPVPGAANLPWTIQNFTNVLDDASIQAF